MTGTGGDTNTTAGPGSPTVGSLLCGSNNGCVAVYIHDTDDEDRDTDRCQSENQENGNHN